MNCIYKTNKYKMSLFIIIKVTCLNISFFVAFCFMKGESFSDYYWVLETVKRLYNHLDLLYSEIILFNDDKALTLVILNVFNRREFNRETVHHALYI